MKYIASIVLALQIAPSCASDAAARKHEVAAAADAIGAVIAVSSTLSDKEYFELFTDNVYFGLFAKIVKRVGTQDNTITTDEFDIITATPVVAETTRSNAFSNGPFANIVRELLKEEKLTFAQPKYQAPKSNLPWHEDRANREYSAGLNLVRLLEDQIARFEPAPLSPRTTEIIASKEISLEDFGKLQAAFVKGSYTAYNRLKELQQHGFYPKTPEESAQKERLTAAQTFLSNFDKQLTVPVETEEVARMAVASQPQEQVASFLNRFLTKATVTVPEQKEIAQAAAAGDVEAEWIQRLIESGKIKSE